MTEPLLIISRSNHLQPLSVPFKILMKTHLGKTKLRITWSLACVALLPISYSATALDQTEEPSPVATTVITARAARAAASADADGDDANVSIESIASDDADRSPSNREIAWLGISSREASEDLTSQLDLHEGVGLVVTYVSPGSPAGKAGLKRYDVLTQFGDQELVHPAQLRKLVRVHKPGEEIKLVFYRNGKQQTASVTLGKTQARFGILQAGGGLQDNMVILENQLKDLRLDEAMKQQMKALRESMGKIKIDQKKVQEEVRRSMEQAGHALHQALRTTTNADYALGPVRKMLENLAQSSMFVDDNASVTVRSSGKGVKSLVNTDDSGTIILVNQPKLHLTAHDKEGRLVFDGEIETADQRAKVPHDLWERVEPLLEKMDANPNPTEEPEKKDEQ
jgi:hypothetical protein